MGFSAAYHISTLMHYCTEVDKERRTSYKSLYNLLLHTNISTIQLLLECRRLLESIIGIDR